MVELARICECFVTYVQTVVKSGHPTADKIVPFISRRVDRFCESA